MRRCCRSLTMRRRGQAAPCTRLRGWRRPPIGEFTIPKRSACCFFRGFPPGRLICTTWRFRQARCCCGAAISAFLPLWRRICGRGRSSFAARPPKPTWTPAAACSGRRLRSTKTTRWCRWICRRIWQHCRQTHGGSITRTTKRSASARRTAFTCLRPTAKASCLRR